MVEQKKTKRERDIKSKLMAAIAMLLVSSIMMVSTTYAWFTLSTAPEVTGITTTIASNGNLEIALSPTNGNPAAVENADTTTSADWVQRNLTWGNMLDMNQTAYNLASLTLAPAQLNAVPVSLDNGSTMNTLATFPLATPSYGNDGRISSLIANASIGGTTMPAEGNSWQGKVSDGYKANAGDYGVRAVGTTSGLSAQAQLHKTSIGNITSFAGRASATAGASVKDQGNALATIMVRHAQAGEDDGNNYAEFVPALKQLTADLNQSVEYIDEALRSALRGIATTLENTETANTYDLAIAYINAVDTEDEDEDGDSTEYLNSISDVITKMDEYGADTGALTSVVNKRNAVANNVASAYSAAQDLGSEDVDWDAVYGVVVYLMKTDGVTINGYSVADIKAKMDDAQFLLGLAQDTQIALGEGSGVYYDIAEIAGNFSAKTTATIDATSYGFGILTLDPVIIKTTYAGTPDLTTLRNGVSALRPAGDDSAAVMDAFYGYVVDLVLRTNAADSYLYLLTEGEQRVYSDSANQNTLGGGSTIVFETTTASHVGPLQNLCESIRVAFFDPQNSNKILGIAKVTDVKLTSEATEETDETTGEVIFKTTITGSLSLCSYTVAQDNIGVVFVGNALTDSDTTANLEEQKVLCALTQNVPQTVSALVYLDGADVTSADVLADSNASAKLNLQFGSSSTLVPMENSDLKNGTAQNP